jgi:hypothetical protein
LSLFILIFQPSDHWIQQGILIPKILYTANSDKPYAPIKISDIADKTIKLRMGRVMCILTPMFCFEHPVGPLLSDPPENLITETAMLPMVVNSVKIKPQSSDTDFKAFAQCFDFSKSCLTPEQTHELLLLLYEYKDLFVKKDEILRMTNVMEMHIKLTPEDGPLKAKPYRTTPDMRTEINKQIQDMLRADIIELSDGVYTSPVFLVPRKDSSFRMVVDYRKLNQQTVPKNFSHAKYY